MVVSSDMAMQKACKSCCHWHVEFLHGFRHFTKRHGFCQWAKMASKSCLVVLQDNSLLQMPPWRNPYLLLACAVSFGLHFLILYVPFLANIFSIVPLSFNEWLFVLLLSLPVILLDEVLKFIGRHFVNTQTGSQVTVVKKIQ